MSKPEERTYSEKQVEDIKEQMRNLFEGEFSGMRSEISRLNKKLNVELRTNEQSGDIFAALHQFSENAAHVAVSLMLKWHKDFGDIDHFAEHYGKPVRNWPLIIGLGLLFTGGILIINEPTRLQFAQWYSTGINAYILGLMLLAGLVAFFLWRRRNEKTTQTQV